ncbi:MAG: cbb3-type cytochrome c oxidase subunit I [Sneathiellales bacterium]|nr:cbb3-type cytochrome c oxidase subunit I [Sneathiellales bacterium]
MKYEPQAGAVKLTMLLSGTVFLLMMIFGLVLRASQGNFIELDPAIFYQILTAHGAGMVGSAALSGGAIMWYFVGKYTKLNPVIYWLFLGLFLAGVVLILGSVFIGEYGGAWTFLFPLPAISGGAWGVEAAVIFCLGYVLIGVGFLLYYLEMGYRIGKKYNGFSGALGWRYIVNGDLEKAPPPTVIAAASVIIFNSTGIIFGAIVLVASIVNLLLPEFAVDALLAKNAIYFFGHVFVNATIYMAVTAVYEIIPEYTGKPWKTSRLFAIGWALVVVFVQLVYFHHVLQDLVMPAWMLALGQIMSYASGIPLIGITTFSLCVYIKGSGMKWDLTSKLLVLSVAGWTIGSIPAVIDGMIAVNKVMHNTLWVPGHFHTYLLLGEVAMAFGFSVWLVRGKAKKTANNLLERLTFNIYALGGFGFILVFLWSGASSIPRRWAVHLEEWHFHSQIGTVFAVGVVLATAVLVMIYTAGLVRRETKK